MNESAKLSKKSYLHWAHWLVIIFSALLTLSAWYFAKTQMQIKETAIFNRNSDNMVERLKERMKEYESALRAGVAAIKSRRTELTHEDWRIFSEGLKLETHFPGVNGIGVIYKVQRSDKKLFELKNQIKRPDFKIYPEHSENYLLPITLIEPYESNAKAVGLDMGHEKNRFEAAKMAEKSKTSQITGPIILVQDSKKTPGFLFYYPYFKNEKMIGMVYAPFIVDKLIQGTLSESFRAIGIRIKDENEILYDEGIDLNKIDYKKQYSLNMYGRVWTLDIWKNTKSGLSNISQPNLILIAGIFIDVLLFFLFLSLSRTTHNAKKLASTLTLDLNKKVNQLESEIDKKNIAKKVANRAAKLATIGELSAGMAHEINNPLTIITGYSMVAKNKLKKLEISEIDTDLEKINSAAFRIKKIIDGLRKFSRDDADKDAERINVKILAEDALEILELKFSSLNIKCTVDIEENLYVVVNEVEIVQVLMNLLSNSAQAISKIDDPWIEFKAFKSDKSCIITITDCGSGIDKDLISKIFNPFYTTKDVGEGTGLGLSISKGIVESNGGTLEVDTESKNTKFAITLKLDS